VPRAARDTCRGACPAAALSRAGHRRQEFLQTNRLFQKVERADLGRFNRRFDGAVTGHDDHRHCQLSIRRPFAQQRHTVGVGHPDVEQDEGRLRSRAIVAGLARIFCHADLVAFVSQNFRQQVTDTDFVIDYQDFFRLRYQFVIPSSGK
jgi:hypothetical protein